ncbi:MAG: hypothetical protein JJU45_00515 [Acidimicrobiia bacterium]|nr:hypothetical protein [Acidimicrobiia bacterium]
MSVAFTEKTLEAAAQKRLGDEKVLAAGIFSPYGSGMARGEGMGMAEGVTDMVTDNPVADFAATLIGGFAAKKAVAAYEKEPPYTALVVTPTHIHAFDATAGKGAVMTDNLGEEYATWDRSTVEVHMKKWVMSFNLFIADHDGGLAYAYRGAKTWKVGGKLVAHLLVDGHE